MIENPEFTRQILEYFASSDVGFPANVQVQDLAERFQDKISPDVNDLEYVSHHVICACQNDLLTAAWKRQEMLDGVVHTVGYIDGLTAKGGDYVRNSKSKYWQKAIDRIRDAGLTVTTSKICEVMPKLIDSAFGL